MAWKTKKIIPNPFKTILYLHSKSEHVELQLLQTVFRQELRANVFNKGLKNEFEHSNNRRDAIQSHCGKNLGLLHKHAVHVQRCDLTRARQILGLD